MSVQVNLNGLIPSPIKIRESEMVLANQIRVDTNPFVPFLSNNLALTAYVGTDEGQTAIIYPAKYAHYQFKGLSTKGRKFSYTKTFHPLATSNWIENSKEANMPKWENLVKGMLS